MMQPAAPGVAPDYGIDAPGVVRNLLLAGGAGILLWGVTLTGLWSGMIVLGPAAFPLGRIGLITAVICGTMAVWMIWESKIGKIKGRERLLDMLPWTGSECVLDIGCGRGLLLIGAAKRLNSGKAIGIDLWQAEDLSGNRPEATLENAKRENVNDRIEVHTADMRALPFPSASFDIVLSSNAIHNLYSAADRAKAIAEITRVLKPGGRLLIKDIRHLRQYASVGKEHGASEIRLMRSWLVAPLLAVITMGSLRPGIVLARKALCKSSPQGSFSSLSSRGSLDPALATSGSQNTSRTVRGGR